MEITEMDRALTRVVEAASLSKTPLITNEALADSIFREDLDSLLRHASLPSDCSMVYLNEDSILDRIFPASVVVVPYLESFFPKEIKHTLAAYLKAPSVRVMYLQASRRDHATWTPDLRKIHLLVQELSEPLKSLAFNSVNVSKLPDGSFLYRASILKS